MTAVRVYGEPRPVAREHQGLVVGRPHVEGAQRARRLAVRELADRARLQIEDVELDATALVPVEGDLVALVRQHRVVERGKSPQLAHIDGSARRGGRGHAGMLAAATTARALPLSFADPFTQP